VASARPQGASAAAPRAARTGSCTNGGTPFATNMLQSGIDIKTLQVLLGHKNLSTTEKYLRAVRLDELEQRVESSRLAAFLEHA
jgi:integrase